MGRIYSSFASASAIPTEIASCPIPENHFEILPCLNKINIFSSISLGRSIDLYKEIKSLLCKSALLNIIDFKFVSKVLNNSLLCKK